MEHAINYPSFECSEYLHMINDLARFPKLTHLLYHENSSISTAMRVIKQDFFRLVPVK